MSIIGHFCSWRDCGDPAISVTFLEHGVPPKFWCPKHNAVVIGRNPTRPPIKLDSEQLARLGLHASELSREATDADR